MFSATSASTLENLRPASEVMKLERLGSMFASRLSFVRSLMRKMITERWQITNTVFDLDSTGHGLAVYRITTPANCYHCVIFSRDLAPEQRSDRVIAEAWDITFALVEGEVENSLLEQMAANVPLQEAGRQHPRVFVISRANKSLRNFSQFVGALAAGQQPDPAWLTAVGYLYRTTAVYGNGKFGIADFSRLDRTPAHQALYEDLIIWAREHCSLEAQELINTMLIELYPELVDSLDDELGCQQI